MMPKYKRKFSRINFKNLVWVIRYWCELILGALILDREFYFAVPLIEVLKVIWIVTKANQCIKVSFSLIIWELIEKEDEGGEPEE